MGYIRTEEMTVKRKAIKAAFPAKDGWKFSIRKRHHSVLDVTIKQYPKGYTFPDHIGLNPYCGLDPNSRIYRDRGIVFGEKEAEAINKLIEIMKTGWWDKSDIQSDYFHTAYYMDLSIGNWDEPAVQSAK